MSGAGKPPARDFLTEVGEANALWMAAYADGRFDDLAGCYAEHAESLAPDADPIVGRAAIREFWEAARAGGMAGLRIVTREVEALGDTIIEIGESTQLSADGSALGRFHYLVIWRTRDGEWLIHREIWNAAPPGGTRRGG